MEAGMAYAIARVLDFMLVPPPGEPLMRVTLEETADNVILIRRIPVEPLSSSKK